MQVYRKEIDGLRAIAILPVVLFHFGIAGFQGGFVGVDIFFVISGFLIGGILWGEMLDTGRVRLGHFYLRRIRRLAPVYFAVILTCLVIGAVIMLPFDFRALGKEIISSSVYLSNVYFFTEAGYFDSAAKEKVLLHTWSLSVEEQFYIFLPLTLLLLKRVRSALPAVLGVVAVMSLLACIIITPQSQTATFYLFPFRAWEMLAGVLLAIVGHQRKLTWDIHASVSWVGLVLIAIAIFALSEGPQFPGWRAVIPVLGAVLVIANGRNDNLINRLLGNPVAVFFGLISYSLYLWHWPIVTLSDYYFGDPGSLAFRWAKIGFAVLVAYLSWKFIEGPTRRAKVSGKVLFGTAALLTTGAMAAGAVLYLKDGLPGRFGADTRTHIAATRDFNQDWRRCTVPRDGEFAGIEICPIGPAGEPQLLVWGDSHVRAFKEGIEDAAFEADVPGLIIWRAGCPPAFDVEKFENTSTPAQNAACGNANRQIAAVLEDPARFPTVLLIGRWAYYSQGVGVGRDVHNTIELSAADGAGDLDQAAFLQAAMTRTVAGLSGQGRQVFVLQQAPEIFDYNAPLVSRELVHGRLALADVEAVASTSLDDLAPRNVEADAMLAAVNAISGAQVIASWTSFCDEAQCSAMTGGFAGYFDNNHITNRNARRVRALFDPVFDAVHNGSNP